MVMHSQVKMKLIEVVNGVKCQMNYLFFQYAGQMSILHATCIRKNERLWLFFYYLKDL